MSLSTDLISQFVKATKDDEKKSTEATVYGTAVEQNGDMYVQLDGSDVLTPVTSTVKMESGERVVVTIKDHSAVVTGNVTTQSARSDDVNDIANEITEVEILVADKVSTYELNAEKARIDELVADNVTVKERITASEAAISEIEADNVVINETLTAQEAEIKKLSTEKLNAEFAEITYATIQNLEATNIQVSNLEATYGDFIDLTTDRLTAIEADITSLEAISGDIANLDTKYADIEFANIGEAAIENFFSKSGMIEDLVISDGVVTGSLVGVTIKGDWIEANTIVADKLVVRGDDGLYYKLNIDAQASQRKLEYLESTGTQYIDTGVIANNNTRVVIDVEPTDTSYPAALFGACVSETESAYGVIWTGNSLKSYYNDSSSQEWTLTVTQRRIIDKNKETTTVDEISYSYTSSEFTTPNTLKLLAMDTNGTIQWNLSAKLYSCQIYDSDVLIRDFIPVLDFEGVPCLYDTVTHKMYYNAAGDEEFGSSGEVFAEGEYVPTDTLHGSVITAQSITAEKVSVSDLVAFGATIGGFNITDHSLYSGVKQTIDASTRGIYMDTDGQFSIGDDNNFMRYCNGTREVSVELTFSYSKVIASDGNIGDHNSASFIVSDPIDITDCDEIVISAWSCGNRYAYAFYDDEDTFIEGLLITDVYADSIGIMNETVAVPVNAVSLRAAGATTKRYPSVTKRISDVYKLEISADSILFGANSKSSAADLEALTEHVKIGTWIDPETEEIIPSIVLAEGDSDFKQVITNKSSMIMEGDMVVTEMTTSGIETENMTVRNEFSQGVWSWIQHGNNKLGLLWKGADS